MTPTFSYGTLVSTPTGTHSQTASPHFTADIMQNSKNKEALRLAEWLEKPEHDGSVCAEHIESATELRRMHAENETLRAGYDAARLEIASLQAQLEAVGAGGVGALMAAPVQPVAPVTCKSEQKRLAALRGFVPATPAQAGEYPELPDCGYAKSGDIKAFGTYTAVQMHAYADATCAAREAAQAAPVDAAVQQDADRYRTLLNLSGATPAGMEPLTDSQITAARRAYTAEDLCGWSYRMGIADAEKHHGITAAPKGVQHGTE